MFQLSTIGDISCSISLIFDLIEDLSFQECNHLQGQKHSIKFEKNTFRV